MKTLFSFTLFVALFSSIFSHHGAAENQASMQNDYEKREFLEIRKHIPKNYELIQIGNIHGVPGFVQTYKVNFGVPFEIEQACHRKLVGVKIKKKEFRVKHSSDSEPNDANAFSISHPVLVSPTFPKDLKKSVVPTGGPEAACLRSGPENENIVWSEPLDISGLDEATTYFIAVPPGIKVRVRALVEMDINLIRTVEAKENKKSATKNKQMPQSEDPEEDAAPKVMPAQ